MADDLLSKLERAEGADREIDAALMIVLMPADFNSPAFWQWRGIQPKGVSDQSLERLRSDYAIRYAPAYTGSLDAALALVERVLPGWMWLVRTDEKRGAYAHLTSPEWEMHHGDDDPHGEAYATTPALAICIALLRAVIALLRAVKASEQTP